MRALRLVLLAAALLAGGAIAQSELVTTASYATGGGDFVASEAPLWRLVDDGGGPLVPLSDLVVSGESVRIEVWEHERITAGVPFDNPGGAPTAPIQADEYQDAAFSGINPEPGYMLHGSGDAVLEAVSSKLSVSTMKDPQLTYDGLTASHGGSPGNPRHGIVPYQAQGRFVFVMTGSDVELKATGDFTLQVLGVDLSGGPAGATYDSGTVTQAVAPGVEHETFRVLVLHVTQGEFRATADAAFAEWVAPMGTVTTAGDLTLYAAGSPAVPSITVPGPVEAAMRPAGDRIAVDVSPVAPAAGQGAAALPVPGPSGALVALVAAGLAVAALAAAALARRAPSMAVVETALAGGQHARAARMAGRILRRHPGQVDALLARSIALSKSGKSGRVVRELRDHLRSRPAPDGSLHYVLGLALLDLGKPQEAREAFEEAVALTPGLMRDIAPRLGMQAPGASPPASASLSSGYA